MDSSGEFVQRRKVANATGKHLLFKQRVADISVTSQLDDNLNLQSGQSDENQESKTFARYSILSMGALACLARER